MKNESERLADLERRVEALEKGPGIMGPVPRKPDLEEVARYEEWIQDQSKNTPRQFGNQ